MAALVPKSVDAMVSEKDENVEKSSKNVVETSAKPTQQRRALNQIQNTVVDEKKKKKTGGDKKKTAAAASALNKKEDLVDGKVVPDSAEKPRPLGEKKSEIGTTLLMYAGLLAMVIKGTMAIGGFGAVFETAKLFVWFSIASALAGVNMALVTGSSNETNFVNETNVAKIRSADGNINIDVDVSSTAKPGFSNGSIALIVVGCLLVVALLIFVILIGRRCRGGNQAAPNFGDGQEGQVHKIKLVILPQEIPIQHIVFKKHIAPIHEAVQKVAKLALPPPVKAIEKVVQPVLNPPTKEIEKIVGLPPADEKADDMKRM